MTDTKSTGAGESVEKARGMLRVANSRLAAAKGAEAIREAASIAQGAEDALIAAAREEGRREEAERTQERIASACAKAYGGPVSDGSGCESGDPLDVTVAMLEWTFARMEDRTTDIAAAREEGRQDGRTRGHEEAAQIAAFEGKPGQRIAAAIRAFAAQERPTAAEYKARSAK